jgi:hypothetical protein
MTKKINSKDKGKRGERAWKDILHSAGFTSAYRSQQFCGSEHSADVICSELAKYHFEVKWVEKLNVRDALEQASTDCGTAIPIVAHYKNRGEWLITMKASDWLKDLKVNKCY